MGLTLHLQRCHKQYYEEQQARLAAERQRQQQVETEAVALAAKQQGLKMQEVLGTVQPTIKTEQITSAGILRQVASAPIKKVLAASQGKSPSAAALKTVRGKTVVRETIKMPSGSISKNFNRKAIFLTAAQMKELMAGGKEKMQQFIAEHMGKAKDLPPLRGPEATPVPADEVRQLIELLLEICKI